MEDIYAQAKRVILTNVKKGVAATTKGLLDYTYICPAKAIYPHQWLWDSCFHTIVTSRFNRQLAKAEYRTLLSQMRPDGFIPQIIVWKPKVQVPILSSVAQWVHSKSHYSKLTQPPVLGIALEELYLNSADRHFLEEALPKVKRHYEYFAENRDPDQDGLISIVLPIESGMDHSPAYDVAMKLKRPTAFNYHIANMALAVKYARMGWDMPRILAADLFSVEDLAVNCIFASGLRSVARLATELGDADADKFASMADKTEKAIIDRCYDPRAGVFYSLYAKDDQRIPIKTIASLMPLMLETLPDRLALEIVQNHLLNSEFFWLRYPLPSVSMCQHQFSTCSGPLHSEAGLGARMRRQYERFHAIWRGPTWVNTNWFIARGLRLHGMNDIADLLTERTVAMVRGAGFWEYYNPLTGEGQGAEDFSWSTLVIDMLDQSANKQKILDATGRTLDRVSPASTPAAPALA